MWIVDEKSGQFISPKASIIRLNIKSLTFLIITTVCLCAVDFYHDHHYHPKHNEADHLRSKTWHKDFWFFIERQSK